MHAPEGPNEVVGTQDHDMKMEERRMTPPCGDPKPCIGDMRGTPSAEEIRGLDGWDWINAQGGDDVAYGGRGMDQFYGQDGNDRLIGGEGHDHFFGGDGDDYIDVSDGMDEPNHVEEIHGNQDKKDEHGSDTCILDADDEGAIVTNCARLTIKPTNKYSGETVLYATRKDKDAKKSYTSLSVGEHTNVGMR